MDIYASDEEKAEAIKQWWRENGVSVAVGIALGLSTLFGIGYWFTHQDSQNEQASAIYFKALEASKNNAEVFPAATDQLMSEFSSSAYSVFGALQSADELAAAGSFSKAEHYLTWVMNNAKLSAHQELARYRLAKLSFEQGNGEQALSILKQSKSAAFASLVAELEGDIQIAAGQVDAAKKAYEAAMTLADPNDLRLGLLQIKLSDVATNNDG